MGCNYRLGLLLLIPASTTAAAQNGDQTEHQIAHESSPLVEWTLAQWLSHARHPHRNS